jgi:hypothetical protein
LNQHRHQIYAAEIKRLRQGALSITPGVQWFSVQERFDGMGVKMVGDFCRFIREEPFIDPQKYIAGFQPVPNFIPGLGKIDFQAVKVSMRVPCELEKRILSGEAPGLDRLLPEATRRVGGFADACHSLAAATTVPPGKEAQLVGELDKLLEE